MDTVGVGVKVAPTDRTESAFVGDDNVRAGTDGVVATGSVVEAAAAAALLTGVGVHCVKSTNCRWLFCEVDWEDTVGGGGRNFTPTAACCAGKHTAGFSGDIGVCRLAADGGCTRARPKSHTTSEQSALTSKLLGFKSRWITCWEWRYLMLIKSWYIKHWTWKFVINWSEPIILPISVSKKSNTMNKSRNVCGFSGSKSPRKVITLRWCNNRNMRTSRRILFDVIELENTSRTRLIATNFPVRLSFAL